MQDHFFDRRLGALFLADAARAIPEGTSVMADINRRLARPQAPRRRALLLASSLALMAASLFAVPPVRATVGEGLQRFGTVLVGPSQSSPWSHPASGAVPEGGALPRLTLAEAQQQAAFPIHQPAFVPAGLAFRFAFVSPDGRFVDLSYGPVGDSSKGMGLQMEQGAPGGGYVIPASAARTMKVHGHDAVYAPGAWGERGEWNPGADAGLLSWQSSGFTYVISFSGLGLTSADLVRIADSMP